jgi:hypothetical protein
MNMIRNLGLSWLAALGALACAKAIPEDLSYFNDPALWEGSGGTAGQTVNNGGSNNAPSHAGQASTPAGGTSGSTSSTNGGAADHQDDAGAEPSDAGAAGAGGEAPVMMDAGPQQPPTYLSDFSVAYQVEINGSTSNYVGCQLQIWNFGFDSAPLNEFKIRYYFTNEVGMAAMIRINWGNINNGGAAVQIPSAITVTEGEMDTPDLAAGADYYLEFSFNSTEQIAPNGKVTFSFQMDAPPQESYTQMGDYSFDPAMTTLTEWDHVVLYRNGQGAWGVEP